MRHFLLRELGYVIGFVVLLLAIYVESYYAMVEKHEFDFLATLGGRSRVIAALPTYRSRQEWPAYFYRPMYVVDRKLRLDFWNAPDPTLE
jgi:hypothetical protein